MTFWLSLLVNSRPLKRIDYPKQICLAHPLSFECVHCSLRNSFLYFICKLAGVLISEMSIPWHKVICILPLPVRLLYSNTCVRLLYSYHRTRLKPGNLILTQNHLLILTRKNIFFTFEKQHYCFLFKVNT